MVRVRLVTPKAVGEDGLLRATTKSLPKHCACVCIFIIAVRWPLTSKNAGNVGARRRENGRWRRRACSKEVGKEASTDRCMGEVSLHCEKLGLGAIFSIGEFHSASLHIV